MDLIEEFRMIPALIHKGFRSVAWHLGFRRFGDSYGRSRAKMSAETPEYPARDPQKLRITADALIAELRLLGNTFDPLELISRVSLHHLLSTPEDAPTPHTQSEAQLEYLLSLFLSAPFPVACTKPSPRETQQCIDLLADFHGQATIYYVLSADSKNGNPWETQMILTQRLQTLHVRGDSYAKHYRQSFQAIATSHDPFLRQHYGFDSAQLLAAIEHVDASVQEAIGHAFEKARDSMTPLAEAFERFDKEGIKPDDPRVKAWAEAHREEATDFRTEIDSFGGPEIFEIAPRDATEAAILNLLAIQFGENSDFWSKFPKWLGWPLNPSLITKRPILLHAGKFYAFHLPLLSRNALALAEGLIQRADAGYWQNTFLSRRDNYVEAEAVRLIAGMLPGCLSYPNLYYDYTEAGQTRRAELDGLILYDDCLLIVEVKASGLSDAARRGAPDSLQSDLTASLDKAYSQATRVLTVVRSAAEIPFSDERGAEILRIKFADYRHVFLISVTREHFASLATQLHIIRKLGLIQGVEWPWAVCLDDLRVIAEMTDYAVVFLQYLTRRVAVNQHETLATVDELDLFGLFYSNGLYAEELPKFAEATMVMLTGYSDRFDEYYRDLERGGSPSKPRIPLPERVGRLFATLQKFRPRHFVSACLHLLTYGSEAHDHLANGIKTAERGFAKHRGTLVVVGNKESPEAPVILLACAGEGTHLETDLLTRAKAHKDKIGSKEGVAIIWQPPLTSGKIRIHLL